MKLSELAKATQEALELHGDCEVVIYALNYGVGSLNIVNAVFPEELEFTQEILDTRSILKEDIQKFIPAYDGTENLLNKQVRYFEIKKGRTILEKSY